MLFLFGHQRILAVTRYGQNGLYLVYRENILRYFQPFDHQGPIYTYFIYLPVYLLPGHYFLFQLYFRIKARWKTLSTNMQWIAWTLLVLFLFFSLSGSRRSYYVLPIVPFAILFTADWILSDASAAARKRLWSAGLAVLSFILLYVFLDLLPAWYYARFGVQRFTASLKMDANKRCLGSSGML